MAKTNETFDQQFKEKLDGHSEKPSALAWERLESQLPKQSKPKLGIWWAIAASVTALIVAGYSFWPSASSSVDEPLLAEKTEMPIEILPDSKVEITEEAEEITLPIEEIITESAKKQAEQPTQTTQKTKPTPTTTHAPQPLIAEVKSELPSQSTVAPIAIPTTKLTTDELPVAMPELQAPILEKTVAQASESEEPTYRVSIYSNGVKKGETPEKNLITELGKTVGQVEGLLGKVDDGLFSLQDKKDNLFASLTSKKSQPEEKP